MLALEFEDPGEILGREEEFFFARYIYLSSTHDVLILLRLLEIYCVDGNHNFLVCMFLMEINCAVHLTIYFSRIIMRMVRNGKCPSTTSSFTLRTNPEGNTATTVSLSGIRITSDLDLYSEIGSEDLPKYRPLI